MLTPSHPQPHACWRHHGNEGRTPTLERWLITPRRALGLSSWQFIGMHPPSRALKGTYKRTTLPPLGFIEVVNKLPQMRSCIRAKRSERFPKVTIQGIWGKNCLSVVWKEGRDASRPNLSSNLLPLKTAHQGLYLGPWELKSLPPPPHHHQQAEGLAQNIQAPTLTLLPGTSSRRWEFLSKQPQQSYPSLISVQEWSREPWMFPKVQGQVLVPRIWNCVIATISVKVCETYT